MTAPRRPIVLLVDDDPDVRLMARYALARDAEVLEADGCDAARRLVAGHDPDVILLDHHMPGTTGLEYAHELDADGYDGTVILFTAHLDDEVLAEARALGIDAVSKTDLPRARALVVAGTTRRPDRTG